MPRDVLQFQRNSMCVSLPFGRSITQCNEKLFSYQTTDPLSASVTGYYMAPARMHPIYSVPSYQWHRDRVDVLEAHRYSVFLLLYAFLADRENVRMFLDGSVPFPVFEKLCLCSRSKYVPDPLDLSSISMGIVSSCVVVITDPKISYHISPKSHRKRPTTHPYMQRTAINPRNNAYKEIFGIQGLSSTKTGSRI